MQVLLTIVMAIPCLKLLWSVLTTLNFVWKKAKAIRTFVLRSNAKRCILKKFGYQSEAMYLYFDQSFLHYEDFVPDMMETL